MTQNTGTDHDGSSAWGKLDPSKITKSSTSTILKLLETSAQGLTEEEASRRLGIHGPNQIEKTEKHSPVIEFLLHFKNPMILILLFAGTVSLFFGEVVDFAVIVTIVLLSVLLTFYQESKAEKSAEMLMEQITTTTAVIRGGVEKEIKLQEVVPGDIVRLASGDIIPADARVLQAKDLFLNQSSLTGESFPVEKTPEPLEDQAEPTTEWKNYLFMGTSVVSGSARAVVVKTGQNTEFGKIAQRLMSAKPDTEFETGLKAFSYLIMQVIFVLVITVFAINAYYGRDVLDSLLFSIALAVGLTPELMPMITSLNLTKGAVAMAKKGVIVKRLPATQNLGSMNVLCTDKTGTLTENRTTVIKHVDIEGNSCEKVLHYSYLNSYYQTGLRSPMDEAVLRYRELNAKEYNKVDEIPFDFVRRRLSVVVEQDREVYMITKGAPEEIVRVSSFCEHEGRVIDLTEGLVETINQTFYDLSRDGFRVLGVAYKKIKEEKPVYGISDEKDMVFLGFIAFIDPPKESAKESIRLLSEAGVELKVVTGDNELVTQKVCETLGFDIKGIVLGSEIANMTDDILARAVDEANVFARVSPVQKERIIRELKDIGYVVGYLGDGINDAPSLRVADVGVSVDNAVDIAKEAADMILLEKDLTVLDEGILEGRRIFGNTMKYIMMGTSSNFGNMLSVAVASLFLPFLPMLPIQILLNNLMYDVSQTTIALDNVDEEFIRTPKRWDTIFIRDFMVSLGPISSLFDILTFLILMYVFRANESLFQTGWFTLSLMTQTFIVFVIRTRITPFYRSRPHSLLMLSSVVVVLVGLALPHTPLGPVFGFVAPPGLFYLTLVGLTSTYIVLAEVAKRGFYKRERFRLEQRLVEPKRMKYLSSFEELLHHAVAVICLRPEETTVDSLISDLGVVVGPYNRRYIPRIIVHLRRADLISFDPATRRITKRQKMKEFVANSLAGPDVRTLKADWRKVKDYMNQRYGAVNAEYKELIN